MQPVICHFSPTDFHLPTTIDPLSTSNSRQFTRGSKILCLPIACSCFWPAGKLSAKKKWILTGQKQEQVPGALWGYEKQPSVRNVDDLSTFVDLRLYFSNNYWQYLIRKLLTKIFPVSRKRFHYRGVDKKSLTLISLRSCKTIFINFYDNWF